MKHLTLLALLFVIGCQTHDKKPAAPQGLYIFTDNGRTSVTIRKVGQTVNYEIPEAERAAFVKALNEARPTDAVKIATQFFVAVIDENGLHAEYRAHGNILNTYDGHTFTVADTALFNRVWHAARADGVILAPYQPLKREEGNFKTDSALLTAAHRQRLMAVLHYYDEIAIDSAGALYVEQFMDPTLRWQYTRRAEGTAWLNANIK